MADKFNGASAPTSLIKYDAARNALAECKAVDEVKDWLDKSAAVQAYGRMAQDKTLEIDAAEIRIRAERKLGELLSLQKAEFGLNKGGRPSEKTGAHEEPVLNKTPTLAEVGVSKKLSSRAQKLAAVPEDEFESEVSDWRERVAQEGERVSARLEKAGENVLKNQQQDIEEKEPELSQEDVYGDFDPIAELEAANKEIERLTKIIESDDSLSAANKENKRLAELCRVLEERMRGFQSSENEAKRAAQMWKNKFDKLERQVKAAGLEDF